MSTPPEVPPHDAPARLGTTFLRWAPLVVLLMAWIGHLSVSEGGWLLDDVRLVRDDLEVARGPGAVPGLLAEGWFPSETPSGTYGPLVRASFALEAPLSLRADGTLSPRFFHLTNLFLHGLCAYLLFLVVLRLLPRRPVLGLAAALCFAVHPIHAGTVGALMGRAELLAVLFSLLTVLCWRAWAGRHVLWLALAGLCWLLALLSKEIALGLPLALFVLDRAPPPEGQARPSRVRQALGHAALGVPLALFVWSWGGPGAPMADMPVQHAGQRLLVGLDGLARTLLQVVLPVGFRGDHSDEAAPGAGYALDTVGYVVVGVLLVLSLLALVRTLRGRGGLFSTVWLLTLALVVPAVLVARAGAPLEHRFAYLVALPLFAGVGALVEGLCSRAGRAEGFALARGALASCVALICLVGLSHREAAAWKDDETFHDHLLERNPQHVRAMIRLAKYQRRSAQELRLRAARLPADSAERQALLAQRDEDLRIARAWSARAVRHELGRRSSAAWRELGLARLGADQNALALDALERARELDPALGGRMDAARPEQLSELAELHFAIGVCRAALGRRETAADAFLTAARLDPDRLDYVERAGLALCRVNRYAEGIGLLREAMRRALDDLSRERLERAIRDARVSALRIGERLLREGEAAEEKQEWKQAVTLYEQAVAVNPKAVEARIRAGWLRGWWFGNYEQAFRYFDEAGRLLDQAGAAADDEQRRLIEGYRERLEEQKREEEAEEGG